MNPLLHVMHVLCFTSVCSACYCSRFILRYQCWASQSLAATSFQSFMCLHQGFYLKGLLRQSQAVMLYTRYILTDSRFIKRKATTAHQVSYFSRARFSSCWNVHTFRGFLAGALCSISRVCCHGDRRSTNGSRKSWRRSGKKPRGRWQRRRGSTMKRCVCAYAPK